MGMKRNPFRLVGDRRFLSRTIIIFLCLNLLNGLLVLAVNVGFFVRNPDDGFSSMRLFHSLSPLIFVSLFSITVTALMSLVVTWVYIQRIVGPLYRIEREINRMTSGDYSEPVRVRTNDEFGALCCALENLRKTLTESRSK